jgi:hypothetical protein
VLVDAGTAAAAGRSGILGLTIDGQPVRARVVGALRRFPTIPPGGSGFVVADEAALASALDAQLPGQGRPDELWIRSRDPSRLRAVLAHGRLSQLAPSFRADLEHRLRSAPIARGVLGTMLAAAALSAVLALVGLLLALVGPGRDPRIEADLVAQGVGPAGLRRELASRLALAGACGIVAGIAIGALLTRLAVASVRAAGTLAAPQPPLITVAPWGTLALGAAGAVVAFAAAGALASRLAVGREVAP